MRQKTLLLLLIVAVFAAGCGTGEQQAQVIVTPTPLVVTATPLPTPTLPPTPTVDADTALLAAEGYLRSGQYGEAVAAFRLVLDVAEGLPDDVRAAALYGLGEAALRDGRFEDVVAAMTDYLARYPDGEEAPHAYFLRGDALQGVGQWQASILDYEQYLALRGGLIDSYVYERIADAHYALGDVETALTYYTQALTAGRSLVPLLALREWVAQVYLNSGQPLQAVAQYEEILAVAQLAGYRAEIMYLAAQALDAAGDSAAAFERYRTLMAAYPESAYAYQALQILLSEGEAVDSDVWGQVAFAAEDYQSAIDALHRYTGELALEAVPAAVYLQLGEAYAVTGNFAAARTSYQTVLDLFPTSPEFGEALLAQGRVLALAGDSLAAIEQYRFLAQTYPNLDQAPEALWRAGTLYEQLGRVDEAVSMFETLGRTYPGHPRAGDGLLRAALLAVNRSDMATAERVLAALGATGSGEDVAAAYLWLGKLAQQNGDAAQAENAFRAAAAADPGGYYSLRATDLLNGQAPFTPPAAYRFAFDNRLELGMAEDWLRATFGITQPEALWPMSESLAADARVQAGQELWELLAVDEAGREFSALLSAYNDDPLATYQLAIWLRGIGAYYYAVGGAVNLLRLAEVGAVDAPAYLARMAYPIYYADLVLAEAEARGFDPLILFALIRQESRFNRYATAAAGEKGLTQVIPSTGEYIAERLTWPDYQHADLFQPYASIAFGAYYLSEQLNYLGYNVSAALAGYNAGPGRAAEWAAASGGDPDLFLQAITIASTQGYVRHIYEQYNVYRQLYGVQ